MINKKTLTLLIFTVIGAVITITSAWAYSHKIYNYFTRKAINEYQKIIKNPGGWLLLGKSEMGNPIFYREFGSGENITLVIGGIHGDEPAATSSVIELARFLEKYPKAITQKAVLVACLNPDGLLAGTRVNSRGVDINRNFPADNWSQEYIKSYNNPGEKPASEKETQLAVEIIKKYKPLILIQMHQPFNTIYANKHVPVEISEEMSQITGLPVEEDVWYPTPGSLGSHVTSGKKRMPVITYEMGSISRAQDYTGVIVSIIRVINRIGDKNR